MYSDTDFKRRRRILKKSDPDIGDKRSAFRRDCDRLIHSPVFRRLQGKTQVYGVLESDFFRNRLTHSLEVAQIAKAIGNKVNNSKSFVKSNFLVDIDLLEFAGLAHDLGHPPFGHNGEEALNNLMLNYGGFEGNAQTLRIIAKLEKKDEYDDSPHERRPRLFGLNPTARTLASVLKYDDLIPAQIQDGKVHKGYYKADCDVVSFVKRYVGSPTKGKYQTIECQIMECADDIAYSTCDMEDALKGGFINPVDFLDFTSERFEKIVHAANRNIVKEGFSEIDIPEAANYMRFLVGLLIDEGKVTSIAKREKLSPSYIVAMYIGSLNMHARTGSLRKNFTSKLIKMFIQHIQVKIDHAAPSFSRVSIAKDFRILLELIKKTVYIGIIERPEMRLEAEKANMVIGYIFSTISKPDGWRLMPKDFQHLYQATEDDYERKRVICDFISGMTDRYATEFFHRLSNPSAVSIFRPL
jgi:dGTPase